MKFELNLIISLSARNAGLSLQGSPFFFKRMVYSFPNMFSIWLSCFQSFADFTLPWSDSCHPGASVECWNAADSHILSAAHRAAFPCEFPEWQNFGSCVNERYPLTCSTSNTSTTTSSNAAMPNKKTREKSLLHIRLDSSGFILKIVANSTWQGSP